MLRTRLWPRPRPQLRPRLRSIVRVCVLLGLVIPLGSAVARAGEGEDPGDHRDGPAGDVPATDLTIDESSGRARYSIAIGALPGPAGFRPSLGLQYTSSLEDGPFGMGWSLPTGEVQCALRFGVPGESLQEGGQGCRRYELDGQLLVEGPSGTDYREFRTSAESFRRIRFYTSGFLASTWESTDPNGIIRRYGQSVGSPARPMRLQTVGVNGVDVLWKLTTEEDTFGNTIEYDYTDGGGSGVLHLSQIRYADGARRIVIAYEPRPDVIRDFRGGVQRVVVERAKEIAVLNGEAVASRLVLRYDPLPGERVYETNRSRLLGVTQIGADCQDAEADTCTAMPERTFTYTLNELEGPHAQWGDVIESDGMWLDASGAPIRGAYIASSQFADVNGDGKQDIIDAQCDWNDWPCAGPSEGQRRVWLKRDVGWQIDQAWTDAFNALLVDYPVITMEYTTQNWEEILDEGTSDPPFDWEGGPFPGSGGSFASGTYTHLSQFHSPCGAIPGTRTGGVSIQIFGDTTDLAGDKNTLHTDMAWHVVDLNADGLSDLILSATAGGVWLTHYCDGSRRPTSEYVEGNSIRQAFFNTGSGWVAAPSDYTSALPDFNRLFISGDVGVNWLVFTGPFAEWALNPEMSPEGGYWHWDPEFNDPTLCKVFDFRASGGRYQSTAAQGGPCFANIDYQPEFVDLNGDGLQDVIVLVQDDPRKLPYNGAESDIVDGVGRRDLGSNPTRSRAYLQKSDGSGFEPAPRWDLPFPHVGLDACIWGNFLCTGPTPNDVGIRMLDLNRDGSTDILWTDPYLIFPGGTDRRLARPLSDKGVLINTGSGWCSSVEQGVSGTVVPGPCASDGLRFRIPDGFEFVLRTCQRHLADSPSQTCGVEPSLLSWARASASAFVDTRARPLQIADVNGDGFPDLLLPEQHFGFNFESVLYSKAWLFDPALPSGWAIEDDRYALPISTARGHGFRGPIIGNGSTSLPPTTKTLDVNDDGIADVVADAGWQSEGTLFAGLSPGWVLSKSSLPDLLERIDTGQGGTIEYTYTTEMRASQSLVDCQNSANASHVECIAQSHALARGEDLPPDGSVINRWTRNPIVASVKRTALNQTDSPAIRMTYAHPRWSMDEKASLGFRLVARTHPDGSWEEKLFLQRPGAAGRESIRGVYSDSSRARALRCEYTQYSVVDEAIPGSIPGAHNIRPRYRFEANGYGEGPCLGQLNESFGAVHWTEYFYDDDYGFNFMERIQRAAPSTGFVTETRTPYEPNNAAWLDRWILGNPREIAVFGGLDEAAIVSKQTLTYGDHGRLVARVTQLSPRGPFLAGLENLGTSHIAYDAWGNVSSTIDRDGRSTEYCYDGDSVGASGWSCPDSTNASHSVRVATLDNAGVVSSRMVLDPVLSVPIEIQHGYSDEPSRILDLDPFGRIRSAYLRPAGGSGDVLVSSAHFEDHAVPSYREDFSYPAGAAGGSIRTATVTNGFGEPWKTIEEVDPIDGGAPRYRGKTVWTDMGDAESGVMRRRSLRSTYMTSCADDLCTDLVGSFEPQALVEIFDGLGRVTRHETLDGVAVSSYRRGARDRWANGDPTPRFFDTVLTKDGRGQLSHRGLDGDRLVFSEECSNSVSSAATELEAATECISSERTLHDYTPDGLIDTIYDAAISGDVGDMHDERHRIRREYDTAGRLIRVLDPDAGETVNTYTRGGQIRSTRNARLQTQTYSYDDLGRLVRIERQDPGERDTTLVYRPGERGVWRESSYGYAKTFDYDQFGRLARETRTQDGHTFLVDTQIDHLGRPVLINYPVRGMLVSYEYAGAYLKRVCEVSDILDPDCANSNRHYIRDVEYDELGRRKKIDYGASERSFEYDDRYFLSEQRVNQTAGDGSYEWIFSASHYDEIGNLKHAAIAETIGFGSELDVSLEYSYDAQNRVASFSLDGVEQPFGYDACGNLTNHEGDAQRYDHATHAHAISLRTGSGESYAYDASGNVSSITGGAKDRYFRFNSSNQLVCQGSASGICDTMAVKYDRMGQRIELFEFESQSTKYELGPNIQITRHIAGNLRGRMSVAAFGEDVAYRFFEAMELRSEASESDSIGPKELIGFLAACLSLALAIHAIRLGVRVPIPQRPMGVGTALSIVTMMCFPFAAFAGGGRPTSYRRWIVSDSLGSSVLELSGRGLRIQTRIFRPFGGDAIAAGAGTKFGTKFAGHRKEENSGLYYMNARWMDPEAGRFVSVDPVIASISRAQSLNGYSYVENNPLSAIDPTGRFPVWNPCRWMLFAEGQDFETAQVEETGKQEFDSASGGESPNSDGKNGLGPTSGDAESRQPTRDPAPAQERQAPDNIQDYQDRLEKEMAARQEAIARNEELMRDLAKDSGRWQEQFDKAREFEEKQDRLLMARDLATLMTRMGNGGNDPTHDFWFDQRVEAQSALAENAEMRSQLQSLNQQLRSWNAEDRSELQRSIDFHGR